MPGVAGGESLRLLSLVQGVDTIWFGVKLGIGVASGILAAVLVLADCSVGSRGELHALPSLLRDRRFVRAGFVWEENANVRGWLTRDPANGEWIMWDAGSRKVLRSTDEDACWRVFR